MKTCVYDEDPLNQGEHVLFYRMKWYHPCSSDGFLPLQDHTCTTCISISIYTCRPALFLISSHTPTLRSSSHPPLTSTSPSQHISPLGSQGEEPDSIHFWIWTFEQSALEWGGQWVRTCEGETYKINYACLLLYCINPPTSLAVFFSNGFRPSDHISNKTIP